ncbi:transposase [Desulfobacterales bacterium HSG16]|nr:transposase [Desulfobacterales bacterium HSG16]
MKKKAYKGVEINKINIEKINASVAGKKIVVGIDAAKTKYFASLMDEKRDVLQTIKWEHPLESAGFVSLITNLSAKSFEVALEPTGTYGDPIRNAFILEGIDVYRVSAKRTHDAAEVYDGVPSWHDAKSAAIVAKLHWDGASELWPLRSKNERDLSAAVNTMDCLHKNLQQELNRLEALISRHWPEATNHLGLDSVSLLELFSKIGGPKSISAVSNKARRLMKSVGGSFLADKKIENIIESSSNTVGLYMTQVEEEEFKYLSNRIRDVQKQLKKSKRKVENITKSESSAHDMGKVVGMATSAVLISGAGSPCNYKSSSQWIKSLGLNLKEKSSGKHQGKLTITKRGSGRARRWLYFASLRLINQDEIVKAWYSKKVTRDSGVKMKAIMAVTRKLAAALWHVAQGKRFDTRLMFDVRCLSFAT